MRGNEVERAHFGTEGEPILCKDGFARRVLRYDAHGVPVDRMHYDAAGQPMHTEVIIRSVQPNQQAHGLGFQPGDVLLTYEGREIVNFAQFNNTRRGERPGDKPRPLKIRRGDKEITVLVSPGKLGITLGDQLRPATSERTASPAPEKNRK
jgi:S1-C subfamily serine protease